VAFCSGFSPSNTGVDTLFSHYSTMFIWLLGIKEALPLYLAGGLPSSDPLFCPHQIPGYTPPQHHTAWHQGWMV